MTFTSDLIDHFRLDAEYNDDFTVIFSSVPGRRNAKREDMWFKKKALGQGSFGIVWLEESLSEGTQNLRAVKEVRKGLGHGAGFKIDYARELYAMARLSRASSQLQKSTNCTNSPAISILTTLHSSMGGTRTIAMSSSPWNTFHTAIWGAALMDPCQS
jgi:hypothetical protein